MPDFVALVERMFPLAGDRYRVELASDAPPVAWTDDALVATLRLIAFDDDGSIRDIKEQEVQLLPAHHRGERGRAFLEAMAAHARRLTRDTVATLMPYDLFPHHLLDVPIAPDAFAPVLSDPRARTLLARRAGDARLLATIDPRTRPPVPRLRDAALEAAILERVDDPAAYAVYGDWLAERGDPRGDLVALQIALAQRPDATLAARADALIEEYAWEWLGEMAWLPESEVAIAWRYGFVRALRFGTREEPSEYEPSVFLEELAELPALAFVQDLEIGPSHGWSDHAFVTLGRVPAALRRLAIETGEYDHAGDLAPAYPALARLESLRIQSRSVELGTIALPALRSLEIVTRGLSRDNLASLRAARWPVLERLVLWLGDEGVDDCDVTIDDLAWIFTGERLPALRHLGLCGRANARPLVEHLLAAPIVARLDELDLAGAYLQRSDLEHLRTHHAALAHLRALHLDTSNAPDIVVGSNVVHDDRFIPVYE